ncbi:MAG: metallopeptidase family protein [Verrucomicrobiota bacterium]|nr:metallopeptidase family protein [Verrucomicrobiota bacterium]
MAPGLTFEARLALAQAEVAATLADLPEALREQARALPVTYETRPTPGMAEDDIAPDTLGLFCGEALNDPPSPHPVPRQIILFLDVLWDFADRNREIYLEEIHTTYLHELGHYFGFDEDDLTERGLD